MLEDDTLARDAFMAKHGSHATRIAERLADFYIDFESRIAAWETSDRNKVVMQFIHTAGNSLVQSTNLLVAGMLAPSGNLVRSFAEAVAMALLCATPSTGVLEKYRAERGSYPVHTAVDRIQRANNSKALRTYLGFEAKAWQKFRESIRLFDKHSHASIIAVASHQRFGKRAAAIVVGTAYDPLKFAAYRHELAARKAAVKQLHQVLISLDDVLERKRA